MAKNNTNVPKELSNLVLFTPFIAYKIASSKIRNLLTQQVDNKKLIGLQIEFKEKIGADWHSLQQPKIVKLYFDEQAAEGSSYFKRVDTSLTLKMSDAKSIVGNEGKNKQGQGQEPIQEPKLFSLGNLSPIQQLDPYIYRKLDFYDQNIDLVFFPVGVLASLTYLFDELIISGCQINMGKKLYRPVVEYGFSQNCFSIKIEGSKKRLLNKTNGKKVEETDGVGTSMIVGHPCPPKWETFLAVFGVIATNHSDINALFIKMRDIEADWNTNVYYVVRGPEEAIIVTPS